MKFMPHTVWAMYQAIDKHIAEKAYYMSNVDMQYCFAVCYAEANRG